jgi:hypothetical protein
MAQLDSNNNLYTFGNEFMYETGVEYKGLYHKQSETNIFTEPVFNSKTSKKLVAFQDIASSKYKYQKLATIQTNYDSITPTTIIITSSDIANKFILRYFLKKINDELIIETTKKSYDDWTASKIDPNMYIGIQIKWYIAGIVDDIFNFNLKIINSQINMPGLRNHLTDPLQYYTSTNYVVPTNINRPTNSTS